MKKAVLITGLLATFFLGTSSGVFAQFEGFIEFTSTKQKQAATTYKYFVKGSNVRVEELDKDGKITGIMLVDTKEGTALALNPERNLYMEVKNKSGARLEVEVTEGKSKKDLHGYKCREVTVVNKDANRKCVYWLGGNDFEFFTPLMQTLRRKENLAVFFMSIEDVKGAFPMVGSEFDLDGNLMAKLEVRKVMKATIGQDLFVIPAGYTKFEK